MSLRRGGIGPGDVSAAPGGCSEGRVGERERVFQGGKKGKGGVMGMLRKSGSHQQSRKKIEAGLKCARPAAQKKRGRWGEGGVALRREGEVIDRAGWAPKAPQTSGGRKLGEVRRKKGEKLTYVRPM